MILAAVVCAGSRTLASFGADQGRGRETDSAAAPPPDLVNCDLCVLLNYG
jgi:hypothetical protein